MLGRDAPKGKGEMDTVRRSPTEDDGEDVPQFPTSPRRTPEEVERLMEKAEALGNALYSLLTPTPTGGMRYDPYGIFEEADRRVAEGKLTGETPEYDTGG